MRTGLVLGCLALALAGCGDDEPGVSRPSVAATATEAYESALAGKLVQHVQALLAGLQGDQVVRDFLEGTDATKAEQSSCYDLTAATAKLTVAFKSGAECLVSSGSIVFDRKTQYLQATLGSSSEPLRMGRVFVFGFARFDRSAALEYLASTADADGNAFKAGEACDESNARCLRGCFATKESKDCQSTSSIGDARLGLAVTLKGEIETEIGKAQVTFKGVVSEWAKVHAVDTYAQGAFTRTTTIGSLGSEVCGEATASKNLPVLYAVSLVRPENLKLDCACPRAGTVSSKGSHWVDLKIYCRNDYFLSSSPSIRATFALERGLTQTDFQRSCGTVSTSSCYGDSLGLGYDHSNLRECSPDLRCDEASRSALGCNADCTLCTKVLPWSDLKQHAPVIANFIVNDFPGDDTTVSVAIGGVLSASASAGCAVE